MKRWHKILAAALVTLIAAGGVGVYLWRRSRILITARYDAPPVVTANAKLRLLPLIHGLEQPTDIQFLPGGGTRLLVLEQNGHGRLVDVASVLQGGPALDARQAPLLLDIWVRPLGEMGLLGVAFHPQYLQNGKLYVYYAPWVHDALVSRISEFELPAAEIGKRKAEEKRVLVEFAQQFIMHQGGQIAFGPDGKLYVGIGDGSTANDPPGNSQNLGSLHGKLLRLDVDGPNLVPSDNPFVDKPGARPEVWAYGLRNPWRFSFDAGGRAIVGDVGQEGREEIDMVARGANMGWNTRQGRVCREGGDQCARADYVEPIHDYDRETGNCVTGGYVATGARVPEVTGKYLFADFVRGRIWGVTLPAAPPPVGERSPDLPVELLGEWPRLFSTFGRDASGDLYVADIASGEVLAVLAP